MPTSTRAPWRYVVTTSAVTAVSAVWYAAWSLGGDGPAAPGYLAMPLGAAVCAWSTLAMLRQVRLEPAGRRFWRLMLVSFCCLAIGYGMLAVAAFRDPGVLPDLPIPAAALVATGLLVGFWAGVRVPVGIRGRSARCRQLLDRGIAFLGCTTLLFAFGLAPMTGPGGAEGWSTQAMVLIVMSSVLAIGGITKVSYIVGGPVDRTAMRMVGAMGLTGAVVAFMSVAGGASGVVPAQAVLMPLAPVLGALATRRQWSSTGDPGRPAQSWLPYLAIAAVDAPLVALLPGPLTWAGRCVIVAAVVVNVLVAIRQFVTIRENTRLLREKRATEDRLRHEVTHDGLTGLANRGLFRDRLTAALAARDTTVLLVDLDDFKTVNDSLGHEIGDQLLGAVADRLREAVGDAGLPARLGGDEFAVLLTAGAGHAELDAGHAELDAGHAELGAGHAELGETVAQRVLDAFAGPMSAHHLLVHASIGLATAPAGTELDQLLRDVDVAMYAAKQRGKANWVRYHGGMEQPVLAHARLGGELRRALDAGEFRVFYQPIMELGRDRVVGIEALVRWQHPDRGMIAPAEFIPAAEATGLVVPLGLFVLREACRQTAAWLAEFGPDALQKVGVNVSARQLHDPDFVADVHAVLAGTGLPADRLVLELTESAVLRGPQVAGALQELHGTGVRLALDDFGTGESSLSLLRAFPASIIKLDKSFVDGIELDQPGTPAADARQAVARAVIQLAGALGLDTVAEGIENEAQVERLRGLGYSLGQGYHLARPMPAADLTRLLAAQRDLAAAV